jgi:hypothetical protein
MIHSSDLSEIDEFHLGPCRCDVTSLRPVTVTVEGICFIIFVLYVSLYQYNYSTCVRHRDEGSTYSGPQLRTDLTKVQATTVTMSQPTQRQGENPSKRLSWGKNIYSDEEPCIYDCARRSSSLTDAGNRGILRWNCEPSKVKPCAGMDSNLSSKFTDEPPATQRLLHESKGSCTMSLNARNSRNNNLSPRGYLDFESGDLSSVQIRACPDKKAPYNTDKSHKAKKDTISGPIAARSIQPILGANNQLSSEATWISPLLERRTEGHDIKLEVDTAAIYRDFLHRTESTNSSTSLVPHWHPSAPAIHCTSGSPTKPSQTKPGRSENAQPARRPSPISLSASVVFLQGPDLARPSPTRSPSGAMKSPRLGDSESTPAPPLSPRRRRSGLKPERPAKAGCLGMARSLFRTS